MNSLYSLKTIIFPSFNFSSSLILTQITLLRRLSPWDTCSTTIFLTPKQFLVVYKVIWLNTWLDLQTKHPNPFLTVVAQLLTLCILRLNCPSLPLLASRSQPRWLDRKWIGFENYGKYTSALLKFFYLSSNIIQDRDQISLPLVRIWLSLHICLSQNIRPVVVLSSAMISIYWTMVRTSFLTVCFGVNESFVYIIRYDIICIIYLLNISLDI